jgi:ribosomal protein S18 acetylase RimI-like enzyme
MPASYLPGMLSLMDEIVTDLSPSALIAPVKNNLYAYFRLLGNSSLSKHAELPHAYRWHSPIPHPWFSGMLSTLPATDSTSNFIKESFSYFTSQKVTSFSWWLAPELSTSKWSKQLLPYGFHYSQDTPGMAIDLSKLQPIDNSRKDLIIRKVSDLAELQVWSQTFFQGYELPLEFTQIYFEMIASLGIRLPVLYYLGYQDDQPVAASTLFLAAGVAGIYNVATLQTARGKGFGTALTLAPLLDAKSAGYQVGVLQSSKMGYNLYRRLGFWQVCVMDYFYWMG